METGTTIIRWRVCMVRDINQCLSLLPSVRLGGHEASVESDYT